MAIKYKPGGVTVVIGRSQDVSLPPRIFRGRAICMHFDTDKSFLLPPSVPGVRNIVAFFHRHPGVTMLVNGHTDLVGDAPYNLQLSNERAAAVQAYLIDKVDDWLAWYSAPIDSKRWSFTEDQNMLATVTDPSGAPYYAGPITGLNDAETKDAAGRFQGDSGLPVDKQLGTETRRALIARYMQLEGTSLSSGTPIVTHGCGKFHPIDDTPGADEGNRRVEIFLFDGAVQPPPQNPCPAPGCTQYKEWVGDAEEDIDLCQPQEFNLRVLVEDDADPPHPIAGAQVSISADGVAPITVDGNGIGTFFDLAPGTYDLTASRDGFPSKTQPVTVPGPSVVAASSKSALAAADGKGAPPPPPPPNTTVAQVVLPAKKIDLIINWGEPSMALQTRHLAATAPVVEGTAGASFWLTGTASSAPSAGPATLGEIAAADLATWTTATPTPIALTLQPSKLEARGQVTSNPSASINLRLDFDLQVTIGASTKSVLRFKQLLTLDSAGNLTGSKYRLDSYKLAAKAKADQAGKEGRTPPDRTDDAERQVAATHPLVTLSAPKATTAKIVVDAQFVDATELWWATHAAGDTWRWYLHPDLGGRQDNLRVLAWTTGGAPMIWFVAISDAAVSSLAPSATAPAADILFFRPPPGANAINNPPIHEDAAGFADTRHQDTTTHILARYLLAPVPIATALGAAGVNTPAVLADQIQPNNFNLMPPDPNAFATVGAQPADPMDVAANVWPAFVPVGLERAIARAKQPHVLFLPLGWSAFAHTKPDPDHPGKFVPDLKPGDRPGGGYHAAEQAKIKDSLKQANRLLWNIGAVARTATATPDPSDRKLWAVGHSAGNISLVAVVQNNSKEVDRIISIDPSGGPFPAIKNVIVTASNARGSVEAFVISSPNLLDDGAPRSHTRMEFANGKKGHRPADQPGIDRSKVDFDALTPADFAKPVVTLPDTAAEPSYWQIFPVAQMNGYLRNLLGMWKDADVATSASDPGRARAAANNLNWYFLFFHEYAVYGGHREGGSVTRTFFEDALGATSVGSLSVTTVEKAGAKKPIPNAKVTAKGPIERVGITDAAGNVLLTGLPPGAYTVEGEAFEEGPNSATANVAAGNGNTPVTLELVFNPSSI